MDKYLALLTFIGALAALIFAIFTAKKHLQAHIRFRIPRNLSTSRNEPFPQNTYIPEAQSKR